MSRFTRQPLLPLLFFAMALCLIPQSASEKAQLVHQPSAQLLAVTVDELVASKPEKWRKLDIVATAYNSVEAQTDDTPDIAAWGDKLKPGMKSIAVSRDLLKMGLKRGSRVWISGLQGEYVVLDKMNKRWRKRIDIYMGEDVGAALNFGKRDLVLHYRPARRLLVAEND